MNVLLLAVRNQVVLPKERVTFDLIGSRDNTGRFDDGFKLQNLVSGYIWYFEATHVFDGMVRNTNRFRLRLWKFGHCCIAVSNPVLNCTGEGFRKPFHVSTMETPSSISTSPSGSWPPVRGKRSSPGPREPFLNATGK